MSSALRELQGTKRGGVHVGPGSARRDSSESPEGRQGQSPQDRGGGGQRGTGKEIPEMCSPSP